MKRKIQILSFSFLSAFALEAQQMEQFSMYMENNYLINPAEAGTTDYVDVKIGYRNQWTGLEGAPKTYFLSMHTPLKKKPNEFEDVTPLAYHGAGFAVVGDAVNAFTRTNIKFSYAYQKPLSQKLTVSAGVHAGVQQYQFNPALVTNVRDASTLFGGEGTSNSLVPDLSFGLWGHTKNFYFGAASFQLIPSKLDVSYDATAESKLKPHHWVTTGIRIPLDEAEHWNFIPSMVFKGVSNAPLSFDVNSKLRYKDHGWLGFSYRNRDAVVSIIGITFKSMIDIAYSYDWTFKNSRQINTNTHELLLGLRLPYHDAQPAPPPFW